MLEISVVVPVYRSEEILPHLCKSLKEALSAYSYEIILVNDHSPDGSWKAIQREAEKDTHIVGLNLRVNVGQDRAIMAGLSHASGRFTVIMDDDLQHLPSDIPALYEEVNRGYDVCYANFFQKKQTPLKNLYSWVAGKVAEAVLRKPREIYMSPFKIIRRDVVDEILKYHGPFPYVDGLLFQITDNISQIMVEHQKRHSGATTHNFWKQSHVFLNLATNFSVLPLRLMTVSGVLCSGIGFLVGVYFLVVYFLKGIVVYGWTALMLSILFFGGAMLISLGMLGEYLARVLMNVNQIPQFIVKERVNYSDRTANLTRKGEVPASQ
jgi:undecaprenyl-phosphate 4-deoxy-4-formamido-L-arabinose transferase